MLVKSERAYWNAGRVPKTCGLLPETRRECSGEKNYISLLRNTFGFAHFFFYYCTSLTATFLVMHCTSLFAKKKKNSWIEGIHSMHIITSEHLFFSLFRGNDYVIKSGGMLSIGMKFYRWKRIIALLYSHVLMVGCIIHSLIHRQSTLIYRYWKSNENLFLIRFYNRKHSP